MVPALVQDPLPTIRQRTVWLTAPDEAVQLNVAEEDVTDDVLIPVGALHEAVRVVKVVEAVKADDPEEQTVWICHS